MIDRRQLLRQSGAALAALGTGLTFNPLQAFAETITLPFENGERPLVKYPQKRMMIGLTARPPQLETPFSVFDKGVITPNDAFFVRYHLADVPLNIDPDKFSLEIKGKVDKPLKLSLADLKKMPSVELVAVNQCSGNSRDSSTRGSRAASLPTAPWATRAGRAYRSRRSWPRPKSKAAPSRPCSAD